MKTFSNFNFHLYNEIVFGPDAELQTADLVKKHGGTKVMVVVDGGGFVKKSGLFDRVVATLDAAGIPYVELGGVAPNPRRSLVYKGVELGKKEGVDFLLAMGGGSTIDTAKAVGLGIAYEGDVWDFYSYKTFPVKTTKVGSIHTIAAAGSELSRASVILDDIDTQKKSGVGTPFNRTVFAIMNPELTYTVPAFQTACGAVDMFGHTLENYFVNGADCYLGDQFAEGLMRAVVKYGPIAYKDGANAEARRELMLCAGFSHDITAIGKSGILAGPHWLEDIFSSYYDTAHGAGLAVMMPAWLRFVIERGSEANVDRVAQFAVKVFGVEPDMEDKKAVALEGVKRLQDWQDTLGMPTTLTQMGVPKEDLDKLVANAWQDQEGILRGYLDLDKDDVRYIYGSLLQ
ncbi:MAG: iron-containing alcohol dehydrogenase [Lachnospiraceae bacterium]|jgi:alcohol dehydrogenase YqhD (iron-dependent ADH family)|nr:iron-containing alcohol dehydrogenase [Lachnospiraceae bacterium]